MVEALMDQPDYLKSAKCWFLVGIVVIPQDVEMLSESRSPSVW